MTAETARRAARWWRLAFAAYGVAMTTATHWPSLELGTATAPAPDKILHMLAFAAAVLVLWQTRWLRRPWAVLAVVAVWAVLDEAFQSLRVLHREVSVYDLAASELGVAMAALWWWALAPVGAAASRARLAWQARVIEDVLSRPSRWLIVGLAGVAGAAVIGVGATWLGTHLFAALGPLDAVAEHRSIMFVVAAFGGGVAGAHTALAALYRRRGEALAATRPCLACGASCRDVEVDDVGRGVCPACSRPFHAGVWTAPMEQPAAVVMRGAWRGLAIAAGVPAIAMAAYVGLLFMSMRWSLPKALVRGWHALPEDLRLAFDLALVAAALALAVRVYRRHQAALYDHQHVRCRICRHDLSGTTPSRGMGRCPECGTTFAGPP